MILASCAEAKCYMPVCILFVSCTGCFPLGVHVWKCPSHCDGLQGKNRDDCGQTQKEEKTNSGNMVKNRTLLGSELTCHSSHLWDCSDPWDSSNGTWHQRLFINADWLGGGGRGDLLWLGQEIMNCDVVQHKWIVDRRVSALQVQCTSDYVAFYNSSLSSSI